MSESARKAFQVSTPEAQRAVTAREKFRIGARVIESACHPHGQTAYVYDSRPPRSTRGTVVGFGNERHNPTGVRVVRDGQKRTSVLTCHMDFWEIEKP